MATSAERALVIIAYLVGLSPLFPRLGSNVPVIFNHHSITATEPQGSLRGELYRSNHTQSIPHEEFLVLMPWRRTTRISIKAGRHDLPRYHHPLSLNAGTRTMVPLRDSDTSGVHVLEV
jgi:hypothetical protein